MKSILMSIKPKYVSMILNKTKTIEVRKRFTKEYRGWVYIYCTKLPVNKQLWLINKDNKGVFQSPYGKIVARFYCDNVEEIIRNDKGYYYTENLVVPYALQKFSCLVNEELDQYLQGKTGYAIHISQLEIFDEPKELSEFRKMVLLPHFYNGGKYQEEDWRPLTKAPQSWQYIEVK